MSNSLSQLMALQKMAAAQKAQATPAPSGGNHLEEKAGPSETVSQVPVESKPTIQVGNSLGTLAALQKKTGVVPQSPLMTPVPVQESSSPKQKVPEPATFSAQQIAGIDETGIEAIDYSTAIRADLDKLDQLITRDTGINAFNIDDCRGLIMRIMPELKKNPMYAGLVIDRDVHNIMHFCLATQQTAIIENTVKKNKAVKASGKQGVKNAMANALVNMSIPGIDDLTL